MRLPRRRRRRPAGRRAGGRESSRVAWFRSLVRADAAILVARAAVRQAARGNRLSLTARRPRVVLPGMSPVEAHVPASSRAAVLFLGATLLLAAAAGAQTLPGLPGAKAAATPLPTPAPAPEPIPEAADSPRASARTMIELASRKGDFKAAARYLQLPPGEEARGPELARRLRAVLERHLDIDLDAVSPFSEGNPQDGLPPGVDTVGDVPDGRGGHDPVFIVRSRDAAGTYWAFSRQTVSRIDGWYDALPDRWVRDWMPERLQRYGPAGLMWWQWMALPALLLVALVLGRILGVLTSSFLHRLFLKTPTEWDERLLRRTSPALTLLWAVAVAAALLPWVALLPEAHRSAPLAPRRPRHPRRLLGPVALGGRVGPVPRGEALGGRQPLRALAPLRDPQPGQGLRRRRRARGDPRRARIPGGDRPRRPRHRRHRPRLRRPEDDREPLRLDLARRRPALPRRRLREGRGLHRERRADRHAVDTDPHAGPDPRQRPERQARRHVDRGLRLPRPHPLRRHGGPRLRHHRGAGAARRSRASRRCCAPTRRSGPSPWWRSSPASPRPRSTSRSSAGSRRTTTASSGSCGRRPSSGSCGIVEEAGTSFAFPTRTVHVVGARDTRPPA